MQHRVAALFAGGAGPEWGSAAREQFRCGTRQQSGRVVRDMRVINEYLLHRTIQRMVLATLDRPEPG